MDFFPNWLDLFVWLGNQEKEPNKTKNKVKLMPALKCLSLWKQT